MKNYLEPELGLGPTVSPRLVQALAEIPGVRVRADKRRSYLRHEGREWTVRVFSPAPSTVDPDLAAAMIARDTDTAKEGGLPLVLASSLSRRVRTALEARGISYADAQGDLHLVAPGLFFHTEAGLRPTSPPAAGHAAGLGLVGIRAVQMLVSRPDHAWTVADLAVASDVSSGQAHRVLAILQSEGMVEVNGRGPNKRRQLRDLGGLLDWLAAAPRARRVYGQLTCSLYARTPGDLASRVSQALDTAGVGHALTGSLAATLLGAGPTTIPRATLRIDPDHALERVADAIGAEITDRGPNLVLWTDTGRVGTHGREQHAGAWLAPPVRIYLDLLADRRGADLAAHFREVILGS